MLADKAYHPSKRENDRNISSIPHTFEPFSESRLAYGICTDLSVFQRFYQAFYIVSG